MSQFGTPPGFSNAEAQQPGPMDRCWMVADNGLQFGPHTETELATFMAVGGVSVAALVWREGMAQWIPITAIVRGQGPAASYPGYAPSPAGYAPQPPGVYPGGASDSNKLAAGLCGIFLGGFGIHKFVMGFNTAGIIMLLVSLTCIGYPVMHAIGLIEGIIYLAKGDRQFHQDYVVNRKAWF